MLFAHDPCRKAALRYLAGGARTALSSLPIHPPEHVAGITDLGPYPLHPWGD